MFYFGNVIAALNSAGSPQAYQYTIIYIIIIQLANHNASKYNFIKLLIKTIALLRCVNLLIDGKKKKYIIVRFKFDFFFFLEQIMSYFYKNAKRHIRYVLILLEANHIAKIKS